MSMMFYEEAQLSQRDIICSVFQASLPREEEEKVQLKRRSNDRKRRSSEWRLSRESLWTNEDPEFMKFRSSDHNLEPKVPDLEPK